MANNLPYIGDPRDASMKKTISVFCKKIENISSLRGNTLLDVGCGDGSFTIPLSKNFKKVIGLDVQQKFLDTFKIKVEHDPRFQIYNMSAEAMTLESNSIDTIITIETIEHIPDLNKAMSEFFRVLRPGGELIITAPNRWFPFENHGMRIGSKEILTRIPLLPYFPFLHDRYGLARVFTENNLDKRLLPLGFKKEKIDYIWPTFEHGGNIFSPLFRPLFGIMRFLENSPINLFGTSILAKYRKP